MSRSASSGAPECSGAARTAADVGSAEGSVVAAGADAAGTSSGFTAGQAPGSGASTFGTWSTWLAGAFGYRAATRAIPPAPKGVASEVPVPSCWLDQRPLSKYPVGTREPGAEITNAVRSPVTLPDPGWYLSSTAG